MKYDESEMDLLINLVIVALGAMAILSFWLMHVLSKNHDMNQLKLKQIKLEHENVLLTARQDEQERTFKQVNRELHDSVKQSLLLSRMNQLALQVMGEMDQQILRFSIEATENAIADVEDITRSLNSDWIEEMGLIDALKQEIEKISIAGLFAIEANFPQNPQTMDGYRVLGIFRIVQEAFNNIIKHSGGSKILFSLQYNPDHAHITITDNGKGFEDPRPAGGRAGMGLDNMETRAKALNAQLTIESIPGKGTSINLYVPYANNSSITPKPIAIQKFNVTERILLMHSYKPTVAVYGLGFALCQFLLWEHQLMPAVVVQLLSIIVGVAIARKKDPYKLAETGVGKAMLALAKPFIIICSVSGLIIIYYGVWLNNYWVMAAGAVVMLASRERNLRKAKRAESKQ